MNTVNYLLTMYDKKCGSFDIFEKLFHTGYIQIHNEISTMKKECILFSSKDQKGQ